MEIVKCPKCRSEIAINDDETTTYDIDCDCGETITPANSKVEETHEINVSIFPTRSAWEAERND